MVETFSTLLAPWLVALQGMRRGRRERHYGEVAAAGDKGWKGFCCTQTDRQTDEWMEPMGGWMGWDGNG